MIDRPDPALDDGTIRLEPLSRKHLDSMEHLGRDGDVVRHTYVTAPFDSDKALTWLARYVRGWNDGSCAGFAVNDAATGEFLGFCALVRIDRDGQEAEIGYMTAPAARGRGVAVRALSLITGWALGSLGLRRVELRISDDNAPSAKVAERAGYEKEGVLRSVHFKEGIRKNFVIYSRTS